MESPFCIKKKKRLQNKIFRLAEAGFSDFATQTKQLFLALSPTLGPKNNMLLIVASSADRPQYSKINNKNAAATQLFSHATVTFFYFLAGKSCS